MTHLPLLSRDWMLNERFNCKYKLRNSLLRTYYGSDALKLQTGEVYHLA